MARSKMIKGMEKASKKVVSTTRGAKSAKPSKGGKKASRNMVRGMAKASRPMRGGRSNALPRKGDVFRCEVCGMELNVTVACHCEEPNMVRMSCCGQDLTKV